MISLLQITTLALMFPRPLRLTVKDIRYIQRQRQTRFSQHFRLQSIPQYPNKKYHQCSIYIAADIVHRAARRHQLKRQLLEIVKSRLMQSSPM
ncbi:ribonuclease P protein component [Patescibacteria group bacterium]|nr:ribonuclease P protein component [Patescibacteria group bacterium]